MAWSLLQQGGRVLVRRGIAQIPDDSLERLGPVGAALRSRLVVEWSGEEVASGSETTRGELRRILVKQLGGAPLGTEERGGSSEQDAHFVVERLQLPTTLPAGKPLPIGIQGRLVSKRAAESVTALIDGAPISLVVRLNPPVTTEQGFQEQQILASGGNDVVTLGVEHVLELAFMLRGGRTASWKERFTVEPGQISAAVRHFVVGPCDSAAGLTRLLLDAEAYDVEADDWIRVEIHGKEIQAAPVTVVPDTQPRRGVFRIDDWVPGIAPGSHPYRLTYLTAGQAFELGSGDCHVQRRVPDIHLERIALSPIPGREASACRLYAKGFIENEFLVDCLVFEVDGMRAAIVGLEHLRPDVPRAPGASLITHQGFETLFDLENIQAGARRVDIIATQRGAESGRLTKIVAFTPNADPELEIQSDDLENLARRAQSHAYGAIEVRGSLLTGLDGVSVTLAIDGKSGAEQHFQSPGRHAFCLRTVPETQGAKEVRVFASRRNGLLYASNPARVQYTPLSVPEDAVAALGALVDRFGIRSKILEPLTNKEILSRLAERQPERIPDLFNRIRQAGLAVQRERERPPIDPPHFERKRLKVLVASWESPGPAHGGGVLLTELLKRLGERHDITLIHTYGIDEIGHTDELKPHLARLISVPRYHMPGAYRGSLAYPLHNYENYVTEVRRTIEMEVLTRSYDLVDYEYAEMGLYVLPNIPRVLTVHEVGHMAILSSAFRTPLPIDSALPALDSFIRNFHYLVQDLPSICPHLVMLTHEDAAAVSRFTMSARVYANPGGIAMDPAATEAPTTTTGPLTLAYVGNYQHPPNVEAALFFATRVMPELRRRYPSIEFHLYGLGAPPAIQALHGTSGVIVEGFVKEIRPRLREATAVVAPIFTGAGQRIKILDAFGAGALVIATDLAMRSLALADGEHYYRANSADEFMNAVTNVIENPERARAVARAGRDHAAATHGWQRSIEHREAIWGAALRERPR